MQTTVSLQKNREVVHYPRLDTVLMIEDAIRTAKTEQTKMHLWKALPKSTMYQTFLLILDYLQASNKIILTKEGKIVWVYADNEKLRNLLRHSVRAK